MTKSIQLWYNYTTREFDPVIKFPNTDEQAVQYIPDVPTVRGFYIKFRKNGLSIKESVKKVYILLYS